VALHGAPRRCARVIPIRARDPNGVKAGRRREVTFERDTRPVVRLN